MARDKRAYLWDVLHAIRLIEEFTAGKALADYVADVMLRAAVERQFEIIGEALSQATKYFPELAGRITDCAPFIDFRNRLIHGYSVISHKTVWGVVEKDIARLKREMELLLEEANNP